MVYGSDFDWWIKIWMKERYQEERDKEQEEFKLLNWNRKVHSYKWKIIKTEWKMYNKNGNYERKIIYVYFIVMEWQFDS